MVDRFETEDGSTTFFNDEFQEHYHSRVGAYTEALGKFIEPCKIQELAKKQNQIRILDICFGLGYNSGVAIQKAIEINPDIFLDIVALENDAKILEQIKNIDVPENYQSIQEELAKLGAQNLEINHRNFKIRVLLGNAIDEIQKIEKGEENKFDAAFLDPFSPKVCPQLWTSDFIAEIVERCKQNSIIATYSCAKVVKLSFSENNCEISEGPKIGRRTGGVIARVN